MVPLMLRTAPTEYINQSVKSLDHLFALHVKIPKLIEEAGIRSERAWFEFWLPILSGLGQQCYHPSSIIRAHAMTLLQRALRLPELESGTMDCAVGCFDNVLFPLLDELISGEVRRLDPAGMDETRMRGVGLLCNLFLHHEGRFSGELGRLWGRVLGYITGFMVAGPDFVREGIRESLKNMLLVMSAHDMFKDGLWEETWRVLDEFMPELRKELFPEGQVVSKDVDVVVEAGDVREVGVEGGVVIVQE
jgi:hypothetical protein